MMISNEMEYFRIYIIYTMLDCDKHCNDILIKMTNNIIQRDNIEQNSKYKLTASIIVKYKQLDADYEKLSDERRICIDDCKRRIRDSEFAGSENTYVPPVAEELRKELAQLDSSDGDDDDLGGGNKRRRRRRRRSFRNKTKRTQRLRSRRRQKHRNQRRNTRRVR